MNTMELIYARGSMLGRDLFHYIVSGIVFALILSSPFIDKSLPGKVERLRSMLALDAWSAIGLGAILIVITYALGHVMLSAGFLLSRIWKEVFSEFPHVKQLTAAQERLQKLGSDVRGSVADDLPLRDSHLWTLASTQIVFFNSYSFGSSLGAFSLDSISSQALDSSTGLRLRLDWRTQVEN